MILEHIVWNNLEFVCGFHTSMRVIIFAINKLHLFYFHSFGFCTFVTVLVLPLHVTDDR